MSASPSSLSWLELPACWFLGSEAAAVPLQLPVLPLPQPGSVSKNFHQLPRGRNPSRAWSLVLSSGPFICLPPPLSLTVLCPPLSPAFLLPLSPPYPSSYHQQKLLSLPLFWEPSYLHPSPGRLRSLSTYTGEENRALIRPSVQAWGWWGRGPCCLRPLCLTSLSNWISSALCLGF